MSLLVQPHRRNPRRSRKAPKKYTDEECPLKGSGQAGDTNGIDFDQYDRQYDGLIHTDKKSLGEIIQEENDVRAMKGLSARLNEINKMDVPDLVKDQLKKLAFGNDEKVKDADFIVPDGQEELMFCLSESESEFESGDETSEDEYFSGEEDPDYGKYGHLSEQAATFMMNRDAHKKAQKPTVNESTWSCDQCQEKLEDWEDVFETGLDFDDIPQQELCEACFQLEVNKHDLKREKKEKSDEIKPCDAPKVQRPMDLLRRSSASHLFFKLEAGFCAICKANVDFTIMTELETKEHGISGMCAPCQRSFFDAPKNNKK